MPELTAHHNAKGCYPTIVTVADSGVSQCQFSAGNCDRMPGFPPRSAVAGRLLSVGPGEARRRCNIREPTGREAYIVDRLGARPAATRQVR